MPLAEILLLVMAGLAGGFLAGMLGVGGGIVFVPVIQYVLEINGINNDVVPYTLSNSLVIVFAVGISGTYKQLKLRNTHLPSAFTTGISAVFSSLILTYLIYHFNLNNPKVFNWIFAAILIITVLRMLFAKKEAYIADTEYNLPHPRKFIPAGLFAGVVTSLSGLGGGVVMVPYFNKILKLPIKFATGLSLSVIPIIAFPLLLFYGMKVPSEFVNKDYQSGYLIWPDILPVIGGAVIASGLGVKFAQTLHSKTIATIFIVFLILTLIKVLLF